MGLLSNKNRDDEKKLREEKVAFDVERSVFEAEKSSWEKVAREFDEFMKKSRDEIAKESRSLELRRQELIRLEAEAKNNFVSAQNEVFKDVVEARMANLDARKKQLDDLQNNIELRLKEISVKEGAIAQRELAIAVREQKADAGFADKASALAAVAERQHNANVAEAERLNEGFKSLESKLSDLRVFEARLLEREKNIRQSEIARDNGYSEERSCLDLELQQKRNECEKMVADRRYVAIRELESEIAAIRKERLELVAHEIELERERVREELGRERTAFLEEKKAALKDVSNQKTELERLRGTLSALESELIGRKQQLEQDEKRVERQADINQNRYRIRNEGLNDEVEDRVREIKDNLEAQLKDSRAENSRLLNSLRNQSKLVGTFENLKRQLGDQDPSEILLRLNSKTDELARLREELATRPTDEMRARFDVLNAENKNLKLRADKLQEELTFVSAEIKEVRELKRKNSELEDHNKSLSQRASLWEAAANEAHEELKRLRAAYERPQEVEARYKEIEMPHLIRETIQKPKKPEKNDEIDELKWLGGISTACDKYGLHFNPRIIKAFHTALKTAEWSPLTVLAGVSGTGKSELPRLYSHFGGIFFEPLSVQPNWDSQESMLGFFNSIDNKFDAQPILRFLAQSQKAWTEEYPGLKDAICMVLLDEMNLAHPELYFAEFLSKLELRRGKKGREVPTLPVKIGAGMKPYELPLGSNVLWTGTMNQDETTKSLSDKVIDRSIIIHFPRPTELKRRLELAPLDSKNRGAVLHKSVWKCWLSGKSQFTDGEVAPFKKFIENMNDALGRVGRAIGHRVWQSIEYYMANYPDVRAAKVRLAAGDDEHAQQALAQAMHIAFEDQLVQKVMPKLRGIDTRGDSKTECLDKIRAQLIEGVNGKGFNLDEDFDLACELGYGQFIWQSANYLKESESQTLD